MRLLDEFSRRRFLRGMLGGTAVGFGLPILDCFLNENGTAFAATGAALPYCFGTWFWGLGLGEGEWHPSTTGEGYKMPATLAALEPFQKRINLFSGMHVFLDRASNATHFTGVKGIMTGDVEGNSTDYKGSIDTAVSAVIGNRTRFRSIEMACDNNRNSSWSAPAAGGRNAAEISPIALYSRIFGEGFADPNSATFTPDPAIMLRKSALSAVKEDRDRLMKVVGAIDRTRLDQFFTSVRALEHKLQTQLEPPEPMAACKRPDAIEADPARTAYCSDAMNTHELFGKLLAYALACGQTRVFNIAVSEGMSGFHQNPSDTTNHHGYSHEEPIDPKLGYQPLCRWFTTQYMTALQKMLQEFENIREGDSTLLDRVLIYAFTDHGEPRIHSLLNYPIITIGSGGGRIKTGMHIRAYGDAVTRAGLTVQTAMGVPIDSWGTESNHVSNPFREVMA